MAQVRERTTTRTRTTPRAALAMEAAVTSRKRRKIIINNNNASQDLKSSSTSSSSGGSPAPEERCSSPSSDESPASCCSSNGSLSFDEKIIKFSDLEVESVQVETSTCDCGDQIIRREMSLSSELRTNPKEVEKKKPTTQTTQPHCILSTPQKMPTESELEEFFAAAEKDIQKQFLNKYNYDIVKDVPLEGRYEWVQLKP